jgi:hypothetical protein
MKVELKAYVIFTIASQALNESYFYKNWMELQKSGNKKQRLNNLKSILHWSSFVWLIRYRLNVIKSFK